MIAAFALGSDNKRYFRGTLPRLAIFTIILMPLLYCAMYLWAFWNPFGEVNKIPAAVVNLDTGAMNKGVPLRAGDQVVQSLTESGQLGLTQTSAETASSGLASGEFYFTITLPENFSTAVVSPNTTTPEKAEVIFTFNDANNYLSTVIGEDAAEQVLAKVNSAISAQGVNQVLVSIQESGVGIKKAAQGSGEIAGGLKTMDSSVRKQLLPGTKELSSGLDKAYSGSQQLSAGTSLMDSKARSVINPIITELRSAELKQFNKKLGTLGQQIDDLAGLINKLDQSDLAKAINAAIAKMIASGDPELKELAQKLQTEWTSFHKVIQSDYKKVSTTYLQLEKLLGVPPGGSITTQLNEMDSKIAGALSTLVGDVNKLNNGAQELNTGLSKLDTGSNTLVGGVEELQTGTGKLLAGANELTSGLESGLKEIPQWTAEQRQLTADTLSTPAELQENVDNIAPTFGTGFAPFFSTLALFVGALLTWMLLTPLQSRPVNNGLGPIRTALVSYAPAILVGLLQATVLFAVIKWALQMPVSHPVGMWMFMVLMSWTFLALIQMLIAVFDTAIGRVVTLALLMVMLISSGGIYPVPTTAAPFQWIHPFDPMTYTVTGMRQLTVAVVTDSRLWLSVAVLVGIIIVSLAVTGICVRRNRRFTMERLYPTIEV